MPRAADFASVVRFQATESEFKESTLEYRRKLREAKKAGQEENVAKLMKARQLELIVKVCIILCCISHTHQSCTVKVAVYQQIPHAIILFKLIHLAKFYMLYCSVALEFTSVAFQYLCGIYGKPI